MKPFSSLLDVARQVPHERLNWSEAEAAGVEVWVRRDDRLPQWCQGNKFYKLFHNLRAIAPGNYCVSFGGPYSNHLHALALAGQQMAIPTIGLVRGHRSPVLSPTLQDADAAGMRLEFLSRQEYARWSAEPDSGKLVNWCAHRLELPSGILDVIPEGGANALGVRGASVIGELLADVLGDFHQVWLAVGTGTTLAGIANGLGGTRLSLVGVPVIGADADSGYEALAASIRRFSPEGRRWTLLPGFCLGGYARTNARYLEFLQQFYHETGVQLDHVYTGKLFWALRQQLQAGAFAPGCRILALHTGGLQGLRGLE